MTRTASDSRLDHHRSFRTGWLHHRERWRAREHSASYDMRSGPN